MNFKSVVTVLMLMLCINATAQFQFDETAFTVWRESSSKLSRSEAKYNKYKLQLDNYDALLAKGEKLSGDKDELKEYVEMYEEEIAEAKAKLAKYTFKAPNDATKGALSTKGQKVVKYEIVTNCKDNVVKVGSTFQIGVIATLENGQTITTKEFGGKNEVNFNYLIKVNGAQSDDKINWTVADMMYLRSMTIKIKIYDVFHPEIEQEIILPISFNQSHVNNDLNNPMISGSITGLGKANVFLISKRYQEELKKNVYFVYYISHFNKLQHFIVDEGETVTFNISSRIYDLDYDTKYFVITDRKMDWSKTLKLNILDGKTQRLTEYLWSKYDTGIRPEDGKYNIYEAEGFANYKDFK